jgi:hypothetical protein
MMIMRMSSHHFPTCGSEGKRKDPKSRYPPGAFLEIKELRSSCIIIPPDSSFNIIEDFSTIDVIFLTQPVLFIQFPLTFHTIRTYISKTGMSIPFLLSLNSFGGFI